MGNVGVGVGSVTVGGGVLSVDGGSGCCWRCTVSG